jgi:hypothetical protein
LARDRGAGQEAHIDHRYGALADAVRVQQQQRQQHDGTHCRPIERAHHAAHPAGQHLAGHRRGSHAAPGQQINSLAAGSWFATAGTASDIARFPPIMCVAGNTG